MNSTAIPTYTQEASASYRSRQLWRDELLTDLLEKWAKEKPNAVAIRVLNQPDMTYAELWAVSRRFAGSLTEAGIGKGDIVGIQLNSSREFVIAYMGTILAGGIFCTLHMPYRRVELEEMLGFVKPKAVICAPAAPKYDAPATMNELREVIPTLTTVIVAGGHAPDFALSMDAMLERSDGGPLTAGIDPDDPSLLCFTSGTTSAPKAVARPQNTVTANARLYASAVGITGKDVVMIASPLTHVYGLCCLSSALYSGATIVLLPHFTPESFSRLIAETQPTYMFVMATHVALSLSTGELQKVPLDSVRYVLMGGTMPEACEALERIMPNGRCHALFGMTECLLVSYTDASFPAEARHQTAGRPLEIDVRIVNAEGKSLPVGVEGELQIRGYSIMPGYMGHGAPSAFTDDGWFRTGDLAKWDENGNFAISGRIKETINRGGIKINPVDVENLITKHPAVVLAAIVPMPDLLLGERCCLFVTLNDGAALTLAEVMEFLDGNGIAKMRWPEWLEILDEMPMTPTKKIAKNELISRARNLRAQ